MIPKVLADETLVPGLLNAGVLVTSNASTPNLKEASPQIGKERNRPVSSRNSPGPLSEFRAAVPYRVAVTGANAEVSK